MRLIFVRHAESVGNFEGRLQGQADFPLSDRGRGQARSLADRFDLEGLKPTRVYSSPLSRAAETARIVSRKWPLEVSYSDDLQETGVGVFAGLTWKEAEAAHPEAARLVDEFEDWGVVDGAETLADIRRRAERAAGWLIDHHRQDDVVVVFSHGAIIRWIIAAVMGTDFIWSGPPLRNTTLFDFTLDNAGWRRRDGLHRTKLWQINRFADASHLDGAG